MYAVGTVGRKAGSIKAPMAPSISMAPTGGVHAPALTPKI